MEGGTLTDQFRDSLDFRLSPKGIVAFTEAKYMEQNINIQVYNKRY